MIGLVDQHVDASASDEPLGLLLAGNAVTVSAAEADAFAMTLVRVGIQFQRVDYERDATAFSMFRLAKHAVGRAFLAPNKD